LTFAQPPDELLVLRAEGQGLLARKVQEDLLVGQVDAVEVADAQNRRPETPATSSRLW
jgi:hypothetical protein